MTESISLDLLQDGVKLDWKGNGDSTAAALGIIGVFLDGLDIMFVLIKGMVVVVVDNEVAVVHLGGLAGLLGLATTLGAGLFLVDLSKHGGSLRLGSVDRSSDSGGKSAHQALGDHTGAYTYRGGGEGHRCGAAMGRIGNAHGGSRAIRVDGMDFVSS